MFLSQNGDIYIDAIRNSTIRFHTWQHNSTFWISIGTSIGRCHGLFIDIYDQLYCSMNGRHQVRLMSLRDTNSSSRRIAGNGIAGSQPHMLFRPRGIFVTSNLDLFVADCGNNRIQMFRWGQINGSTIISNETHNRISLSCPTGIVVDGNGFLFITEFNNHRIIGSNSNGYRCIAACNGRAGSTPYQLNAPRIFNFDTYGNIYVADGYNHRVQKFLLSRNACGEFRVRSKSLI